jgi:tetratricopeptide (TPR) repeat protein
MLKNSKPKEGLDAGFSALGIATKLENDSLIADSWNVIGANYLTMGMSDSALACYERAYSINDRMKRQNAQALVLNNIGSFHYMSGDYYKALQFYIKAANLAQLCGNKKQYGACTGNIGIVYTALSDFPQAIEYNLKALKVHTELGLKNSMNNNYLNLGATYRNMNDFPKAFEFAEKAISLSRELGDINTLASALSLRGQINFDIGKYDETILNCRESLKIIGDSKLARITAINYSLLGRTYSYQHAYDQAIDSYRKSISILKEINDVNNLSLALQDLGMVYLNAPDTILLNKKIKPSGRYSIAMDMQKESLEIAIEMESLDRQATALDNISKIYERQHNFEQALIYYKKATVVNDSIYMSTKKQDVTRLEMQFEFDKREALTKAEVDKKAALAELQLETQKTKGQAILGGSILLLLAGAGAFVSYKRNRDIAHKKMEADFKLQVSDTEMKALRSQMNPHFIFNSLNSIGDYIGKNEMKAADTYLSKFAKLMRQILENSDMKEVTLADDLTALENYMQLEALRLRDKFKWEIEIDPTIDINNTMIPPLILQPFVENSIWHGISKKNGTGTIKINVFRNGDMINCVVEDDGVGRKFSTKDDLNSHKKSFGMQITQARIDILNRIKKSSAEIRLSDLTEGLKVEVKLPYLPAF